MVILGGAGSMFGVVLGAIMVSSLLEILREPGDSRYVFYAVILLGLVAAFRPTWKLAAVLGGTIALGFALRLVADGGVGHPFEGTDQRGQVGWPTRWSTLGRPTHRPRQVGADLVHRPRRARPSVSRWSAAGARVALLVPTLYLAVFVWENVMTEKPEPTRLHRPRRILVATMIARPAGILGEKRVEIL